MTPLALSVRDLTVAYGASPVLWDVDVDVPQGSLTAVIGPNGAGKSTLLKASLGLVPVLAGTVSFFGRSLRDVRTEVAYVPQRSEVDWGFPVDVLEVALMGTYGRLGWFRRPGAKEREWAMACLEKVGMVDLARRPIGELSGGQQQRAFLARALAQDAQLTLMDEPFAGVDQPTEETVVAVLREMRSAGKTVVAVHHDLQTAADYFDRAVLLNVSLVEQGEARTVLTPETIARAYRARAAMAAL